MGCSNTTKTDNKNGIDSDAGTGQLIPEFETKSSSSKVSIDLTPRWSDSKLYVDAGFNTHSGNLRDYDLKKLAHLEYDGKSIAPSSVPDLSGHHGGGTFIFDIGGSKPDKFTIKIKGISEIEERIFNWP